MFKGSRLVEHLKSRPSVKVDERTAYMVNPSDYGALTSAFTDFEQKAKAVKVSPKATDELKSQYAAVKKRFDSALSALKDAIMDMGDTEETSEAARPVPEAKTGDALLKELEDILSTKTAATIDGVLVDLQTAMLVSQVASGLNPENKAKFLSKGIATAATIAWKLVK